MLSNPSPPNIMNKLLHCFLFFLALPITAQESPPVPAQESPPVTVQDSSLYRLKSNDQVRLTVFREPDLDATEQLTAAGEVSFPLIGSVRLLGLTIAEAEALVTARYDADYLVSPSLSINVLNAADEVVSILGAVNNPGKQNIAVNDTLDLVTAIDSSGGLAAHADPRRIELKRDGQTMTFNWEALRAPGATQVVLKHGDHINVPASPFANKTVTILGQISDPGVATFPVSGKLTLDVLVAERGGPTEIADVERITIERGGKIYSGTLGKQQGLLPGDLVTIPVSRFAGKSVTINGSVGRPGNIPFPLNGRLKLLDAINRAGGFTRLARKSKVTIFRTAGDEEKRFEVDCDDIADGEAPDVPLQPGDRVNVNERIF